MNVFEELDAKIQEIYAHTNGNKLIIWGWGETGQFLYSRFLADNKKVDCVIDENFISYGSQIRSHYCLEYYNPELTSILVTPVAEIDIIKNILKEYGYCDKNIIYVREYFYGKEHMNYPLEYYQWLEYQYGVEILEHKSAKEQGYLKEKQEFNVYGYGKGYPLEILLREFQFKEHDAVFDFGCGKGEALIMFARAGVYKLGGIEYDSEIYDRAVENLKMLNIQNEIMCGNAMDVGNDILDDYNYFFMFDPFVGDVFRKVIENIEKSYEHKRRKIILIYGAPRCHKDVIKNNKFKFVKECENLYAITRTTNIYILN